MPWDFWLIFVALGVLLPWRGQRRLKKLLSLPETSSRERIALYFSTIAFQWAAVAIVLWRCKARGVSWAELGLVAEQGGLITVVSIAGASTFGLLHWINLRRIGKMPAEGRRRDLLRSMARRILPQSGPEIVPYLALAITAGICEEVLYRGFAMAALQREGLPLWSVVLISAVLFGLAHLYQGGGGMLGTLLLGAVFSVARSAFHSLIPVVVWHATVDVVAGVAGPRYLVDSGHNLVKLFKSDS